MLVEWLLKLLAEPSLLYLLGDTSVLPPGIIKQEFGLALADFTGALRIDLYHWRSQTNTDFAEGLK